MSVIQPIRITPSLLDADLARLAEQVAAVEAAGVEGLHLDVMDGHFVPNLSLGVPVVASLARHTKLLLDAHLMVTDPRKYAPLFADAGAGSITFHIETTQQPRELIKELRQLDVRVGVALNPGTPAEDVLEIVDQVDVVLVMTVWPGFGGQKLIPECLKKIETLAEQMRPEQWLQVDGGVNVETVPQVVAAGANTLVMGSAIFGQADPAAALRELRRVAGGVRRGTEQPA
jgi:ribulose-phosphate 3-epimerase